MENGENTVEPKKITIGTVMGWIVGVVFIIAGVGMMTTSVVGGLLTLIAGLVLIPTINDQLKKKANLNLSGGLRFVIAIILFAVGVTMSSDDTKTDVVGTVMEETTTTETTETAPEEKKDEATKEWVKVTELKAGANKQSETFTLEGGQQKIKYTLGSGQFGMCSVYVVDEGSSLTEDGGFPVVMISDAKTDETMMRKGSGDYYFDLQVANADCTVELYEYR